MLATRGLDSINGKNYGNDIRLNYTTRAGNFNQRMHQGYATQHISNTQVTLSYMVRHNVFLDLRWLLRQTKHNRAWMEPGREQMFTVGLRMNIEPRNYLQ
jgi:hypothetical protein